MIIVGLTGGIGSGKTTVAAFFKALGIPIYIADVEAKRLMVTSKVVRRKLIALFGDDAYQGKTLNKPFIASKIFNDRSLLEAMNAIVHPKVGAHFKRWLKKQNAPYVIKEAAIIFEQGMEDQYDLIITVTADIEQRIQRVVSRDDTTREKVETILKNQWTDAEKIEKSDFVIVNNDISKTKQQVHQVHQAILEELKKNRD